MKFYKTKKFFFCVFTYLIFYKKVLKYVSVKKMYSFQWKFENIFVVKKEIEVGFIPNMGLSPAPGVKY